MKIIVVDDEISSLHLFLDEIISHNKIEYKFFKDDVNSIIAYLKENKVDGAFLDINMPNINGVDLAKEISKESPNTKIVFVTGTNFSIEELPNELKDNAIGVIYKPANASDLERYIAAIGNEKRILKVKTFGSFDCFIDGKLVKFSTTKSKELFALLIMMNGKGLTMEHAITYLWPDKNIDKAKILYRDAVWRLRLTLKTINFNCVEFGRALLVLDKTNIECDYYELLDGKDVFYNGELLTSYDWSIEYENEIEFIKK